MFRKQAASPFPSHEARRSGKKPWTSSIQWLHDLVPALTFPKRADRVMICGSCCSALSAATFDRLPEKQRVQRNDSLRPAHLSAFSLLPSHRRRQPGIVSKAAPLSSVHAGLSARGRWVGLSWRPLAQVGAVVATVRERAPRRPPSSPARPAAPVLGAAIRATSTCSSKPPDGGRWWQMSGISAKSRAASWQTPGGAGFGAELRPKP